MEPLLTVKDLVVGVNGTRILKEMDFDMQQGETVVIIGSNGAGKSLLVRTLIGLLPPIAGTINWRKGVKIGYVPQKFAVGKHIPITTGEFLALKGPTSSQKIAQTLALVGLPESVISMPLSNLSGGQFQKMIVAWAIIDDPTVLVFDEPTESVDIAGQASIYSLINSLKRDAGITVFLVTHDLDTVYSFGDRVLCLSQGSLVCSDSPKKSLSPEMLDQVYGHALHNHGHEH